MAAISAGRDARPVAGNAVYYECHRPEQTLLYQIVEEYYPAFLDLLAAQGRALPPTVQREFEDCLRCGRLEHGFLRVRCERCHAEKLFAFSWPLLRIPAPAELVIPFTSQRVFKIDIETCGHCGGVVKIIVCIEDPRTNKGVRNLFRPCGSFELLWDPAPLRPSIFGRRLLLIHYRLGIFR